MSTKIPITAYHDARTTYDGTTYDVTRSNYDAWSANDAAKSTHDAWSANDAARSTHDVITRLTYDDAARLTNDDVARSTNDVRLSYVPTTRNDDAAWNDDNGWWQTKRSRILSPYLAN